MSSPVAQLNHNSYIPLEEYWNYWYGLGDVNYEYNNGVLEEKPSSTRMQSHAYQSFFMLLARYTMTYGKAEMMGLRTGFAMNVPDDKNPGMIKTTVRRPDLAAICHDNPVIWGDHDHYYKGICDLCIEFLSDSTVDLAEQNTRIKKAEYEFAGVKEYYILDPHSQMHCYYRNATGVYEEIQPDTNGVIHSHLLAGLQFRPADLTG